MRLQLKSSFSGLVWVLFMVCFGCGSGKLVKSWSADGYAKKLGGVLVIARSPDLEVRKSFEDAMVQNLNKQKIEAVSGLARFPELVEKENITPEESNAIKEKIESSGFRTVLLMALKDTKTTYVSTNKPSSGDNMIYDMGRYGVSFVDYYNVHSIEYLSKDINRYTNTDDSTDLNIQTNASYNTYYLEALLYDLERNNKEELVSIYEVEYVEPRSLEDLRKHFTKTIAKQIVP